MLNTKRKILSSLKKICQKHKLQLQSHSGDWIIQVEKDGQRRFIYGYNFDLNPSGTLLIANDKAATYQVLDQAGIPAVPHLLFLKPELFSYIGASGNWPAVLKLVEKMNFPLVVKSNQGTGGKQIYFVNNQQELEQAFQELFVDNRGLAISPYVAIKDELRFVILKDEVLLSYRKNTPVLIGDGRSTFIELLQSLLKVRKARLKAADIARIPYFFDKVLDKGEIVPLHQLHNLGKGANPELIKNEKAELLARKAAEAIGLQFGSVDLLLDTQGNLSVLEINAGVMMEALSERLQGGSDLAFEIYEKAVLAMFD